MSNFQLKNYVTCKKVENMTHTQNGKKAVNENKLWEAPYKLDLVDKDFKGSIINMFKEYIKELTENMLTMTQYIGTIDKEVRSI